MGVQAVRVDVESSKVSVSGKVEAEEICEKLRKKFKKKVELVAAPSKKTGGASEKKAEEKPPEEEPKEKKAEEKKPEDKTPEEQKAKEKKPKDKKPGEKKTEEKKPEDKKPKEKKTEKKKSDEVEMGKMEYIRSPPGGSMYLNYEQFHAQMDYPTSCPWIPGRSPNCGHYSMQNQYPYGYGQLNQGHMTNYQPYNYHPEDPNACSVM